MIDSIAAPIRAEFEQNESRERTLAIHQLGGTIHTLAREMDAPVVSINQVKQMSKTQLARLISNFFMTP